MKRFLLLIIGFSFAFFSFSGTRDSLIQVTKTSSDDLVVANTLNELAKIYEKYKPDSSNYYALKSYKIAKQNGLEEQKMIANYYIAHFVYSKKEYEECILRCNEVFKKI